MEKKEFDAKKLELLSDEELKEVEGGVGFRVSNAYCVGISQKLLVEVQMFANGIPLDTGTTLQVSGLKVGALLNKVNYGKRKK